MGDTGALAALYDTTFIRLRDGIVADGATADTVSAVIAATFVEVWHVSPHRVEVRADVEAWLAAIASQRMAERRFTSSSPSGGGGPPGAEPSWSALATKDHDQLMKMTLLDILHGSP
jgi:DNA-directed RNA polymerase specialized sigma24 family protein